MERELLVLDNLLLVGGDRRENDIVLLFIRNLALLAVFVIVEVACPASAESA
jgi:hypothetical protein